MGLVSVATEKTAFDSPVDPISTSGMLRFARSIDDLLNDTLNGEQPFNRQVFTVSTELGITGGAISAPSLAQHTVAAENGSSDELDTIGVSNNSFLVLKAKSGHTITLRHGFGNVWSASGASAVLSGNRAILLWCQGGQWSMIGVRTPLTNKTATADPSSGDDAADGYSVGSIWINTTLDRSWICTDATTGAALWKRISPWKNAFLLRSAAAIVEGVGTTVSIGGTGSGAAAIDNDDTWTLQSTGATSGSLRQISTYTLATVRPAYDPVFELLLKTGSAITDVRYWLALADNAVGLTDDDTQLAGHDLIGFRYSSVAADTGWRPVTHDGTTQNTGAAIGTVAPDTIYKFKIRVDSANARAFFSVNNGAETILSANLPPTTLDMAVDLKLYTQSNNVRSFLFSSCEVGW